jgi:hypothetical protein
MNVKIPDLTPGTPDKSTTLFEAAVFNENTNSYDSASVTPEDIRDCLIKDLTGTLEAGETQIIFQDAAITADCKIEFFSKPRGIYPTNQQSVPGILTLTYSALAYDLDITVRIT